jgi:hypothetical protein
MSEREIEDWRVTDCGDLVGPHGSAVVEALVDEPTARFWVSKSHAEGSQITQTDIPHEALAEYLRHQGYEVRRIEP